MTLKNCPDGANMDFDRAYANFDFIEGSARLPDEWANRSANLLNKLSDKAILGLPYGAEERQRFDLFLSHETPKGLMVFIHGGYWSETHRDLWSYLAEGGIGRGWAVALPSYTLAPEARISDITQEIRRALPVIAARVPQGDLVVTGHSAGGIWRHGWPVRISGLRARFAPVCAACCRSRRSRSWSRSRRPR